jgi:hypothetical protein
MHLLSVEFVVNLVGPYCYSVTVTVNTVNAAAAVSFGEQKRVRSSFHLL